MIIKRNFLILFILVLLIVLVSVISSKRQKPILSGDNDKAIVDKIIIEKSKRVLMLFRNEELVKTFPISLGGTPKGHKSMEGDKKTPEGKYSIDWKHPNSSYYLSLRISYPNNRDRKIAKEKKVNPGGDIMIHGMPDGFGFLYPIFKYFDWTNGCIAISNTAMEKLVKSVRIGTPVIINP